MDSKLEFFFVFISLCTKKNFLDFLQSKGWETTIFSISSYPAQYKLFILGCLIISFGFYTYVDLKASTKDSNLTLPDSTFTKWEQIMERIFQGTPEVFSYLSLIFFFVPTHFQQHYSRQIYAHRRIFYNKTFNYIIIR